MEEIARLYGYDNIPRNAAGRPAPAAARQPLADEERVRDLLVTLGLQEVITHRMTAPEIEARLLPSKAESSNIEAPNIEYVRACQPHRARKARAAPLAARPVLNVLERNARLRETLAFFEIGAVYVPQPGGLPLERAAWQSPSQAAVTNRPGMSKWASNSISMT